LRAVAYGFDRRRAHRSGGAKEPTMKAQSISTTRKLVSRSRLGRSRTLAPFNPFRALAAAALSVLALTSAARAAEPPAATAAPKGGDSRPDDEPHAERASVQPIDRAWLYLDDAKVAPPGAVIGMTSVSYTSVGANPDPTSAPYRAFAFNTAQPGALASLGGEVGLLPRVSLMALGQVEIGGQAAAASPGAVAGLRFDLTPASLRSVHLLASGGYLRETWSAPVVDKTDGEVGPGQPNGDNGAWVEGAVSADIHEVRLGLTGHAEHVFADGRDSVDLMFKAGASYRITDWFRAGVEWVGQDLEESFRDAAEGGARQFVGPTAAVQLLGQRLTVVAGPSLGISDRSPKLLGRLAVAYAF
jgi:hypothetical protein